MINRNSSGISRTRLPVIFQFTRIKFVEKIVTEKPRTVIVHRVLANYYRFFFLLLKFIETCVCFIRQPNFRSGNRFSYALLYTRAVRFIISYGQ